MVEILCIMLGERLHAAILDGEQSSRSITKKISLV